jgi:hypothetical protein
VSDVASDGGDSRYDPQFQRGYEPPDEVEPEEPPARRNPWLIVLWMLGALMLAGGLGGLWLVQMLLSAPNPESASSFYVVPVVLQSVAPWLAVVGLLTIVGVIFVHAVRWR